MPNFSYLRGMLSPRKILQRTLGALFLTALVTACASMGNPNGGLYDETPPVLQRSTPAAGATGVTTTKINLRFDENVKLDQAQEKLIVSPPQVKAPIIRSNARTVTIELQDSLQPNTTYSIDLGDAVQDNNEGNPLEGLALTFSTGDHVDSLQVSGMVLNAEDLEPMKGVYVGVHAEHENPDSLFRSMTLSRAGRTDSRGRFTIRGLAPGRYHVYALADGNTNYRYDLFSENIAFCDTLVNPSKAPTVVYDTIAHRNPFPTNEHDSVVIDSIVPRNDFIYYPNNLRLRLFSEGRAQRYLDNVEWKDSMKFSLRFAEAQPRMPQLTLLDPQRSEDDRPWYVAETSATFDTLSYWIADTTLLRCDTLMVSLAYAFTDTTGTDILRVDTIPLLNPYPPLSAEELAKRQEREAKEAAKAEKERAKKARKAKKNGEEVTDDEPKGPQTKFMKWGMSSSSKLDIGGRPHFEAKTPVDSLNLEGMHLYYLRDSVWHNLAFRLEADTLVSRRYTLHAVPHFTPGMHYRFVADSAAIHDIYGCPVDSTCCEFAELTPEDYAHLLFNISGVKGSAFVELLDAKDNPVQRAEVRGGQAKFVNVKAGKYYARLVEDANGNGRFDAGNLDEHRQPESVYYFDALLELRTNWSFSQSWDVHSRPIEEQKPRELLKNKPDQKRQRRSRNETEYGRY